jgi:hypothetical protein
MRFMVMVKTDEKSEAGVLPDEKLLAAMGEYNAELTRNGMMLAGEGLQASAKGARVKVAGKKFSVFDGPFAEAKEMVGGFWILQAPSKDEIVEWVKRAPFRDGEVEIRPLYELEDFPVDPAEQAGGWRDQEREARQASGGASPGPTSPARQPGTARWMLLLKADRKSEAGLPPDPRAMQAMGALMEEMGKAGVVLGGEGLKPSAKGARVRFADGKRTVIDGPFTEAKELIAGYLVLQTRTREEAVEWARRWLQVHVDVTPDLVEGQIEVRRVFELEDFPVSPAERPGGWRAQEKAFRDS